MAENGPSYNRYLGSPVRSLIVDGDEVDEAPNAYEKYKQRPESLGVYPMSPF